MKRRELLKLLAAGAVGSAAGRPRAASVHPSKPANALSYQGSDLTGWETAVGDAIYVCPGQTAVTLADLVTTHRGTHSTLETNIHQRPIMAHNITFKRFIDETALDTIHTSQFQFRLPYSPSTDPNSPLNGQTIEGGLFVWDGITSRLDMGIAFQWEINPWFAPSGNINTWTGSNWVQVGSMPVDTAWHTVQMKVDMRRQSAALLIDNTHYPTQFTFTPKPNTWAANVAARLQAEIVSIDPRPDCTIQAVHKAAFRNWTWYWEPAGSCQTFLPLVGNGG